MLTIFPVKNPEYYASDDYYVKKGERVGVWDGYLAKELGLPKTVELDHYNNVLQGKSPFTGKALFQENGKEHRPAWDCCFSMPKSASLLLVISNRESIIDAHERAVSNAIKFMERHAARCRRGHNGAKSEKLPGLLVSRFTHFESRETQDQQSQVNGHTHCLVQNIAMRNDGTWGAIDSRVLYQWKMAIGAVYRSELAKNLRNLRYEIEADKNAFKIKGISKELCDKFSSRKEQIVIELQKYNLKNSSNKAGDKLSLFTRKKKSIIPVDTLFESWKYDLNAEGLNKSFDKRLRSNSPIICDNYILSSQALSQLTESKSTFREQDLFHNLAVQGQFSDACFNTISQIGRFTLRNANVLSLGLDSRQNNIFTTKAVVDNELKMLELANTLKNQRKITVPSSSVIYWSIEEASKELGFPLDIEQEEVVYSALTDSMISIVQGNSGTGKSTCMSLINKSYSKIGLEVVGASIAKKAADSLQEGSGIKSYTLAKLITQFETNKNPLIGKAAIVVDEAGLLSVSQLISLFDMALGSGTKVILVGDDRQLQAIEHSGALKYLSKPEFIGNTRLETIRRQKAEWARKSVISLKDGNSLSALTNFNERGLLHFNDDFDKSVENLVSDYFDYLNKHKDKKAVVIAQKWRDVVFISEKIRQNLQSIEKVGEDIAEFDCYVSEKHFKQKFGIGDRVRFSKNDYKIKVSNGSLGTVSNIVIDNNGKALFEIKLDSGRKIKFIQENYITEEGYLPLVQAYATTVYSAQGITVEGDSFILYSSGMDRANTYVAGSRHTDNCHWYFNKLETDVEIKETVKSSVDEQRINQVMRWMNSDNSQKLAIEYLQKNSKELIQQQYIKEDFNNISHGIIC
ncbi:MobF family relaxase [Colwellia sp. 20A7]|uniref:MobF family relaxase n=1 Tax=Colwellia sp. 20A7 TaxID=2689569 RepID=UPI00135A5D06|nr:MobF family relaxase [Colwellia sp. 20A7]